MKKTALDRRAFLKGIGLGGVAYLLGSYLQRSDQVTALAGAVRSINVMDYINNNMTIQNAIDDVQAAGGGELYFPPGVYFTQGPLIISSDNVILKGANKSSTIIAAKNYSSTKNLLEIKRSDRRIMNVKLADLTLTSDARVVNKLNNDTALYNHGIVLDGSHNVEFENIKVDHFNGDGLRFQDTIASGGPDQVVISNCTFAVCRNGLNTNDTGHSTHINGGTFEFNAQHGICTGGRNSVYIKDADVEQNHFAGIRISHSGNIVVRECTFENNSRSIPVTDKSNTHILVGDKGVARNIVIDSCYFHARRMRSLIYLIKTNHVSISNNFIDYADQFGALDGSFVQTSSGCKNVYCDDFSYRQTPKVKRISDTQYAVSDMKPSAVPSLPIATESTRGFFTRVEGGKGHEDTLYVCVKTATGSYKWVKINTTDI